MFDVHRSADWASQQANALRAKGFDANFTFTEEFRTSENPAFFVDLDKNSNLGRLIVLSTGDFDMSVISIQSDEPTPIFYIPTIATESNFTALSDIFVKKVLG